MNRPMTYVPDLNRTPVDAADSERLIAELRDEIRRRPSFVAIEAQDDRHFQPKQIRGFFDLEITKTYIVTIRDSNGLELKLAQAVCVGTPEQSATFSRIDTNGSSQIVCTETESRTTPIATELDIDAIYDRKP